jgi:hypothetical protein
MEKALSAVVRETLKNICAGQIVYRTNSAKCSRKEKLHFPLKKFSGHPINKRYCVRPSTHSPAICAREDDISEALS